MIRACCVRILPICLALGLVLLCYRAVEIAKAQPPGAPAFDPGTPPQVTPVNSVARGQVSEENRSLIPQEDLLQIIKRGGVLMAPILICSFVMFVFVFERAIVLRRGNILPRPFVKRFMLALEEGQLKQDEAIRRCEENGSHVATVFAAAVRKWGRSSVEVEQAMIDAGERITNSLRRNLRVLNGVATVCPLLGLLGTVVGMIQAFNAIANSQAMGRPELLADGISQALLTTAAGLSVAIPALIFYLYFVSCVDRRIVEIDALGQQVVQLISGDGAPRVKKKSA